MSDRFSVTLPFGAQALGDGAVKFRLWAPSASTVSVVIEDGEAVLPMARLPDGWFELTTRKAQPGTLYRYRVADNVLVPDPASRFQPRDVNGPSEVIDPLAFRWRFPEWRGRKWEETVFCEAHVGCFSPDGGYDGMRRRLDYLADLGITALELMPLADFEGKRNWGYDGALPFAPDSAYGRPERLKRLIDEAHGRGLMVFIDVVYNHFGPSGNYLAEYAEAFFTERHRTPWGAAIDFAGGRPVRDFFITNALYWIEEYRADGLRLDAVQQIVDESEPHILVEIANAVRDRIAAKREVHLVLENGGNLARYLERGAAGQPRTYTAQWNDDFHHAAHAIVTGETQGYYGDYQNAPAIDLGRALAEGFVYQGQYSRFRSGPRGEPSNHLPPAAFVAFLQNHDQIGNRALGERLDHLIEDESARALLGILLLAPHIPLLFMGEEWASARPFLFFCDFKGELADAVREGRRHELRGFPGFHDPALLSLIPDPNAESTFAASHLDWEARSRARGRRRLALVRELLALRQREVIPALPSFASGGSCVQAVEGAMQVRWPSTKGTDLHLVANVSPQPSAALPWVLPGRCFYASHDEMVAGVPVGVLPPWSVCFAIEQARGDS